MLRAAVLLLLLVACTALASARAPIRRVEKDEDCEDCVELSSAPSEEDADTGACCYGDRCIGDHKTENQCTLHGYVWAGADSECSKCHRISNCCLPVFSNSTDSESSSSSSSDGASGSYTCGHKACFECVLAGGVLVDFCDECAHLPPPTHPPTTTAARTWSHAATTAAPTPVPPSGNPTGACCKPNGRCEDGDTAVECNNYGGYYRGDGTNCDDHDTCRPTCCDPLRNVCIHADTVDECIEREGVFSGFGTCSMWHHSCGGRCCVNGKAVTAQDEDSCTSLGGTNFERGEPNEDWHCPRACCTPIEVDDVVVDAECTLEWRHECTGVVGSLGQGCTPGVCGGACCTDEGEQCQFVMPAFDDDDDVDRASRTCHQLDWNAVYQGDGTVCSPDLDLPDDDDEFNSHRHWHHGGGGGGGPERKRSDNPGDDDDDLVCFNDGACCVSGRCHRVASMMDCQTLGGTYQGMGSRCDGDDGVSCSNHACCTGRGCIDIDDNRGQTNDDDDNEHVDNAELECRLKGGTLQVAGTSCELPGVCDASSGACCCDGHCLNVPDSTTCREFGGHDFAGHGTSCDHEGVCAIHWQDGACCIHPSYLDNANTLCQMMPSAADCVFHGGHWQGSNTTCFDDEGACRALTGACCMAGAVYDDLTANECTENGGHWAGPNSRSGDEGVCDPRHKGACCLRGRGCETTTYAQCKRENGNYQGPQSSCQDTDVCAACLPCRTEAPDCDYDEDCPAGTQCIQAHGKCFAPATRIPAQNQGEHPPGFGFHGHDHDAPNSGPFTCGSAATIGQACILHPCNGKCAVGVCSAPPAGFLSQACESICTQIHEYDCDCQCKDPWWQTCAFVSGRLVDDLNANGREDEGEPGIAGANVTLSAIDPHGDHPVFVATQQTGSDGHFAFTGLPGGKYLIEIAPVSGFRMIGDRTKTATVECIPDEHHHDDDDDESSGGSDSSSSSSSRHGRRRVSRMQTLVVHHQELSNHIAENIIFFASPNPGAHDDDDDHATHPRDDHHRREPAPPARGHGHEHHGISNGVIVAIVVSVLVVFGIALACAFFALSRAARRARR